VLNFGEKNSVVFRPSVETHTQHTSLSVSLIQCFKNSHTLVFFFHSIFSLFIPSFASSSSYGSVLPIDLAAVKHLRWQDLSEMKWNQRRLPEAIDDVMAGQISCIFGNADVWRKHIKINETKTSNSKKMILHRGLLCVTFLWQIYFMLLVHRRIRLLSIVV
jgi:hypothetical protein